MTRPEMIDIAGKFINQISRWQPKPGDQEKKGRDDEHNLARLAILRRNAGEPLNIGWFYSLVYQYEPYSEDALFLVATLLAHDRLALTQERQFRGNLGLTFNALWSERKAGKDNEDTKPGSGIARRFGILLNSDYDEHLGGELPFRLRQTVRWIISQKEKGVGIDWPLLLYDLQRLVDARKYETTEKSVQKDWARAFYAPYRLTED